jgi:hypothetical protein
VVPSRRARGDTDRADGKKGGCETCRSYLKLASHIGRDPSMRVSVLEFAQHRA